MQETFISHLTELRKSLIRAFSIVLILFFSLVYWASDVYSIFVQPLKKLLPATSQIVFNDVTGAFLVPLKITFLLALLIALPWVLYQIWSFIAPGLYKHERQLVIPLVLSSYILFWIGLLFVYYLVLPMIFKFLVGYSNATHTAMFTSASEYVDFVLQMFISFGMIFEIPVAIFILVKVKVISIVNLYKIRPYMIVGAFIIAAIFTPPDPFSQIMMAIPICLLYELGIIVAKKWAVNDK